MARDQQINRLLGLLAIEMIRQQISLPTDSHTSPPPSLTSGVNDELVPNTADLRVTTTYERTGQWTFIRTALFLSLNWRFDSG